MLESDAFAYSFLGALHGPLINCEVTNEISSGEESEVELAYTRKGLVLLSKQGTGSDWEADSIHLLIFYSLTKLQARAHTLWECHKSPDLSRNQPWEGAS